jgi:hypothetical protein
MSSKKPASSNAKPAKAATSAGSVKKAAPQPPHAAGAAGGQADEHVVTATTESIQGEPGEGVQIDGQGLDPVAIKNDKTEVTAFLVSAKRDGFRRANRSWRKEQTRVPVDELSEDEVAAIMAEPMLDVVSVVD